MLDILFVCVLIFIVLMVNEVLWRKKILSGELSRKAVHIIVGVIMAFSALYLTYQQIQLLSLAFIVVILGSTRLQLFKSIRAIRRDTSGEIFFALGIGVCAVLEPEVWVYIVAILHLALADSLAALVGVKWGKKTAYSFWGNHKSILGTGVFFVSSVVIILVARLATTHLDNFSAVMILILIPAVLTMLENLSWHGIDNLTVPVAALTIFTYLSS